MGNLLQDKIDPALPMIADRLALVLDELAGLRVRVAALERLAVEEIARGVEG